LKKSDIVQVEVQLDVAGFSEDIVAALGKIEAAIYNLKDALCAQLRKDNFLELIMRARERECHVLPEV